MTPEQEAMLSFVYSVVLGHEAGTMVVLIMMLVSAIEDGVKTLIRKFRSKRVDKD